MRSEPGWQSRATGPQRGCRDVTMIPNQTPSPVAARAGQCQRQIWCDAESGQGGAHMGSLERKTKHSERGRPQKPGQDRETHMTTADQSIGTRANQTRKEAKKLHTLQAPMQCHRHHLVDRQQRCAHHTRANHQCTTMQHAERGAIQVPIVGVVVCTMLTDHVAVDRHKCQINSRQDAGKIPSARIRNAAREKCSP
jgi:hypothetical protein